MAEDVADITVAVEAAGANMAEGQLEGLEEQLEETANAAEDQAGSMQDISERFKGTMSALVTGLAVASAGLLSQVPVLGEAFSGLASVAQAVAFQMDKVLRPILQPVADGFFKISQMIFGAKGAAGALIGSFGTLTTFVLGFLTPVGLLLDKIGLMNANLGALKTSIGRVIVQLSSLIGGSLAAAAAIGVFVGGLGVLLLEVTGVLDAVRGFGQYVANSLPASIRDGLLSVTSLFTVLLATIGAAITGFVQGTLKGGLEQGVETAVSNVRQVLATFVGAWRRTVSRVGAFAGNLAAGITDFIDRVANGAEDLAGKITTAITDAVDNATDWGRELIENLVSGISENINLIIEAAGKVAQALEDNLSDGIIDAISQVGKSAESLAKAISEFLPRSPAEKGPLSDLDQTGPGLVDTFAGGIEANVGTVESAGDSLGQAADPAGVPSQAGGDVSVFISGRQVEDGTAQYRDDAVLNRGRPQ